MNRFSLFAAAFAGIAMPALAQQNEVYIEQRGVGNQLTIDQSEAENSRVGGLTIGRVLGVPADALQRRPLLRNVLNISVPESQAALQDGRGNSATVNLPQIPVTTGGQTTFSSPTSVDIGLVQDGSNNTTAITASGIDLLGSVAQIGSLNRSTLELSGSNTSGSILQSGIGNRANLSVSGSNAEGYVGQIGRNNDSGTVVVGGVDTSVTVLQIGSNLAPVNGQGVSVISNAASVSITQIGFGSGN